MRWKMMLLLMCAIVFIAPVAGLQPGERVSLEYDPYPDSDHFERELKLGTIQVDWTIEGYIHNDHNNYELRLWLAELEEDHSSYSMSTIDVYDYSVDPGDNLTFEYEDYLGFSGGKVVLVVSAHELNTELDAPGELTVNMEVAVYDEQGNVMVPFEDVEIYGSSGGSSDSPFLGLPLMLITMAIIIVGMFVFHRERRRR